MSRTSNEHPSPALASLDPIAEARRQWIEHGWVEAADGMEVVTAVTRVQQLFQNAVDSALRPHGLTFARYELLTLLSFTRTGALPLGKVGARLQVHAASVTSAVDRLERDGHVERRPNPDDGRSYLAAITEAGRDLVAAATSDLNEQFCDGRLDRPGCRRPATGIGQAALGREVPGVERVLLDRRHDHGCVCDAVAAQAADELVEFLEVGRLDDEDDVAIAEHPQ
ncbi:MAG: MarR family transcriptional regulator [Acidimicrobiales bacterium]